MTPAWRRILAEAAWSLDRSRPHTAYALLRESQWWPAERLQELQLAGLRACLVAAAEIPFWRARFAEAGLDGGRLRSVDELRALPPLTRDDVQREGIAGLSRRGARGTVAGTSGSTGRPVAVLQSPDALCWWRAERRRFADALDIRLGDRRVSVMQHVPPSTLRRRAGAWCTNAASIGIASLADRTRMRSLVESLVRRPPAVIGGNASGLYVLARHLLDDGLQIAPKTCWSSGEMLQPRYRDAVERAFGCRVRERYASAESGFIGFECAAGGMHVAAESHLVEVVRADGRPAQPGEPGDVLITTFRSRAMPLVRYRLGDVVVAPDGRPCPCGRGLPVLGKLVGRANSILRTPAGGLVAPSVVGRILDEAAESVIEYRLVQQADLRVDLKVVQRDTPSPERVRADLAAAIDGAIGFDGGTIVERVEAVERSAGGKFDFIFSHADGAAVG